jgi:hypothetical protein
MTLLSTINSYELIGAGNFGLVVQSSPTDVIKLFKDTTDRQSVRKEADIQTKIHGLCKNYLPEVYVPEITCVSTKLVHYKGKSYLSGITMNYLKPPVGYTTQVHTLLGYDESDIDCVWGMRTTDPVSPTNPPRGFFASPYTLEDIWEAEGSSMTIEHLATLMGKAHRLMVEHGILPIDLEWVWSGGRLCVIDFGLCEYGHVDPIKLLEDKSSIGLATDFYIPHKGDRGYDAFLEGYGRFKRYM